MRISAPLRWPLRWLTRTRWMSSRRATLAIGLTGVVEAGALGLFAYWVSSAWAVIMCLIALGLLSVRVVDSFMDDAAEAIATSRNVRQVPMTPLALAAMPLTICVASAVLLIFAAALLVFVAALFAVVLVLAGAVVAVALAIVVLVLAVIVGCIAGPIWLIIHLL